MKRLRRAVLLLTCVLAACFPSPAFAQEEEAVPLTGEKIYVYNWGEYIADGKDGSLDINTEFTRRTGIEVDYSTFDTNESLYSKLVSGGASYDVIIPSDYMVSKMINEGMLEKLDFPISRIISISTRNTAISATIPPTSIPSRTPGAWSESSTISSMSRKRWTAGIFSGMKNTQEKF